MLEMMFASSELSGTDTEIAAIPSQRTCAGWGSSEVPERHLP